MLILGQIGLLIVLVRASVSFSHPVSYALIWSFFALLGVVLTSPTLSVLLILVFAHFILATGYFYLLEYSDGSWWWWAIMLAGGWLLLML